MEGYLLAFAPPDAAIEEGTHEPDALLREGGVWIHAAGRFALGAGRYVLQSRPQWVGLAVESGEAALSWQGTPIPLRTCELCFLPAGEHTAALGASAPVRCLWFALDGPLAPVVVRRLGAPDGAPLGQRALPGEMTVLLEIVRAAGRCTATEDASYRLAQLLYALLGAHWGEPPAVRSPVSREIARVVDALRAGQYRDNLSLTEMARIAGLPPQTFRKRFASEMGLPPAAFLLHGRMERAKALLRVPGTTVGQAGAQVGIQDPYRFSKQFRGAVGISPSEFMRRAAAAQGMQR